AVPLQIASSLFTVPARYAEDTYLSASGEINPLILLFPLTFLNLAEYIKGSLGNEDDIPLCPTILISKSIGTVNSAL
ncbi:hypothetical protein P4223_22585, partial [Bacillus thuringiensis]|nr:hypothetical protein [Bacillus thuringiensis]